VCGDRIVTIGIEGVQAPSREGGGKVGTTFMNDKYIFVEVPRRPGA